MKRNIVSVCLGFLLFSLPAFTYRTYAQIKPDHENMEKVLSFWSLTLEQVRVEFQASKTQFDEFQNFYRADIDSLKIPFMKGLVKGRITMDNVKEYVNTKDKPALRTLFKRFKEAEANYPSSVEEYKREHKPKIGGDSCFPSCYNTNFSNGYLDGWYGYYLENSSTKTAFDITNVTGGYLGHVVKAAEDPLTGYDTDYQIHITSGSLTDNYLLGHSILLPQVSPWASGGHSVMLGDSILVEYGGAILSQSFQVTASTASLVYEYAVLLENPGTSNPHTYFEQPFFTVTVLDQNGDTIPICGHYQESALYGAESPGFIGVPNGGTDSTFYKNWTLVNVPLNKYIGQCVTIIFETWDCALGGHYGYAYVTASCTPLKLISSSPNFCGQDSISLTAPPGDSSYLWTGPKGGIIGDSNSQTIWVDSAGVYRVVTIPVTGAVCADTLYDTIGKSAGPPPRPSFTATRVCNGQTTVFTNNSNPITGTFDWDFYNLGIYNDTNVVNPTWIYVSPGVYNVKLHELYNGCGTDTVVQVYVDTSVLGGFFVSGTCINTPITMNNNSVGSTSYSWNFGDPTLGSADTSSAYDPTVTYTATGTYSITLIAKNAGPCPDTVVETVTVYAIPMPVITGKDSICPRTNDTLSVTGGLTYIWSNGYTTTTIIVAPAVTRTYTVTSFNGTCERDTTFTVYPKSPAAIISASKDSICSGDTVTLEASGNGNYRWSTNNTATRIVVSPHSDTTYTLYATFGTCKDSTTVTISLIKPLSAFIAQPDSVCPNTPVTLTVTTSGGVSTGYKWSTGETSSTITVSPLMTTTYTATVYGKCDSTIKTITVNIDPLPKPVIKGTPWKCKGVIDTLTVSGGTKYLWGNGSTKTTYYTGDINADSTITVTAYNSLGCSHDTSFSITVRTLTVSVGPHVLACSGESVLLTAAAAGTGPFTYSWSPGGATTDTVTVNPDTVTNYVINVSNGCKAFKTVTVTPDFPTLFACCDKAIIRGDDTIIYAIGDTNLKSLQWLPDSGFTCLDPPVCDTIKVAPLVTTTYTVIETDKLGCTTERVVTIIVEIQCFNFTVPNVFTPDFAGPNGLNSFLYIKTENLSAWSITIFDRWGKEMFKSTNPLNYWAGTTEGGSKASDGVYYYIISATCQGNTYKKDGFVQLIR